MIVIHQRSATSTRFLQQILVDRLLQVFNLNLPLILPSYPLVIASNNLPHMICYESIADIAFLYLIPHISNLFLVLKIFSLPTPTAPNLSPARSLGRNEQRTWQLVRLLLEWSVRGLQNGSANLLLQRKQSLHFTSMDSTHQIK